MFGATNSATLVGVDPQPVRVEVHVGGPKESFSLVGLPDTAVREARDRVRAAMATTGGGFPRRRVIVNLAPADLPKAGSAYDLPIALAALAAAGGDEPRPGEVVAMGELALDGTVRSVRGGFAAGAVARDLGLPCLLPPESAREASLVSGADVRAVTSLEHAAAVAAGDGPGAPIPSRAHRPEEVPDLAAVRGQAVARRALEVAAAGGHHLLLLGPPGAGKTMLAKCIPGILPPLDDAAALDVVQAWAATGRQRSPDAAPPFRAPHHSATLPALVGGGTGVVVPGELTLAHRGVLFLDELGEFPPSLLDALRQPLEEGSVVVARKGISVRLPCSVQVVAATNPCPCGYLGDARRPCRCTPRSLDRYRRRLSGPLVDRFDMRVPVDRLAVDDLDGPPGEPSVAVGSRVARARVIQSSRGALNRALRREALDALSWEDGAVQLLRHAAVRFGLTGRGWDRVRRVARTVADLDGGGAVTERHLGEALAYRGDP